eukprot:gb/GEZN01005806.1/.p1 GENE.gb/GEZN01005806.1/~~gb/GEZN01005806.1/.p1  ORF type:complete len:376 (-),score=30.51 gb/GEZN01005806.1/:622-1674(-)
MTPTPEFVDPRHLKLGPLRLAPLRVPFERRLQTLLVLLVWSAQVVVLTLTCFLLWWSMLTRLCMLGYFAWICYDDCIARTAYRGERFSASLRSWSCWHYFTGYFPISLIKEADLPPEHNYLFGYHPHGVISVGIMGNFLTEATGFHELFPGIRCHVMVLNWLVRIPFSRELFMRLGVCSANKDCGNHILKSGPGESLLIAIGGAQEALDARPGTLTLTLSGRFGFIKMALENGAHLVPVLSFGENDLFGQVTADKGSWFRHIQDSVQHFFKFSMPMFHGRGIFNYDVGFMPYRRPCITVVGKPILVPLTPHPSNEQVRIYHELYVQALKDLYEKYKDVYFKHRTDNLKIR